MCGVDCVLCTGLCLFLWPGADLVADDAAVNASGWRRTNSPVPVVCCLCCPLGLQDLERQVASLESELSRYRSPDLRLRAVPLDSSTTISLAPSGVPDSVDTSRAASRRTSVANLALSAASPTAAAAAANGNNGVDRHSSSGASGGGADGGSGGGAAAPP